MWSSGYLAVADIIEDEGYESGDPDEEQPVPEEQLDDVPIDWPASEDEVDENGNLRGFIEDDADEDTEGEENAMDVDGVDMALKDSRFVVWLDIISFTH